MDVTHLLGGIEKLVQMKKIIDNFTDYKTTIPGIVVMVAANVAFFTKMIEWPAYVAGMTAGAGLVGINTKSKK